MAPTRFGLTRQQEDITIWAVNMRCIIDFETTRVPKHYPWFGGYIVSLAAYIPEHNASHFWLLNHTTLEDERPQSEVIQDIRQFFIKHRDCTFIAHNAKFELHWLLELGINIQLYCTQVAEYTLNGQSRGNSLSELALRYGVAGKTDLVSIYWDSDYETDEIPISTLREYNINDCRVTYEVYRRQQARIKECGPKAELLVTREMMTLPHLTTIERNGMVVDESRIRDFAGEYANRIIGIDGRLRSLLHTDANFGSPEQVSYLLFGRPERVVRGEGVQAQGGLWNPKEVGAVVTKKKGVYCTDKATISQLPVKRGETLKEEVKRLLIERTNTKKQLTTYFVGMQEYMVRDGTSMVVHPNMNQCVTRTGRLSSSQPNLQNVSRGSTSPVKRCFVSRYEDDNASGG